MIRIRGQAELICDFEIELNMTEETWNNLDEDRQSELIERYIDWREAFESSELDAIDVWDVEEIEKE